MAGIAAMGEGADPAARPRRGHWLVWLFAALGVAAALAIVFIAIIVADVYEPREPAIVAAENAAGEALEVGNIRLLEGTGLIAIEIRAADGGGRIGSKSYSDHDLRNLLLLDRRTGSSRRLLPGNSTTIVELEYFPAAAQAGRSDYGDVVEVGEQASPPAPAYYLLTLERKLENGARVYDLLAGSLATGKQGVVMRGLSGVEQASMLDATRLGVVVREGTALYYRLIDVPGLKQVESHRIEIG